MNAYILGAGFSKAYDKSPTDQIMPIANDFFPTFNKLKISENQWVLVGNIINYLVRFKHIKNPDEFAEYASDIEQIHSEIESNLKESVAAGDFENASLCYSAYNQLVFLFASVINEVQNGTRSEVHEAFIASLTDKDAIITFNWDTLIDRVLKESENWSTEYGYCVKPYAVYRNKWEEPAADQDQFVKLIKLHGSTNWLSFHPLFNGKEISYPHDSLDDFFVYESTESEYSCHSGRFMDGYESFSYGYYPPNIPLKGKSVGDGYMHARIKTKFPWVPEGSSKDEGITSMPLIIPPVKDKKYDTFGTIFKTLWQEAEEQIAVADKIFIMGYSFPATDYQSNDLFKKAFSRRSSLPDVVIVNPYPDKIVEKFWLDFGIPTTKITVHPCYIDASFDFSSII
ncbi:hypothetical protein [Desulfovibrio sp. JC022]|uniref:hypothetical protein n=1 Tax=Desulfovibrio sp. JC022 TaxID=2593642 RepID=UPI0013D59B94|nr:hypothetical protein [Desulfovibrio sp. JC022]NDV24712.1 hypothetical protein [Desulfovibrio sp. JC022]